jgi:catechol 2,3-dioxygenase-like lactoylglutathione lyase family enzyme
MDHAPVINARHHGKPMPFDPNVALGWSGDLMVEFLADNGSGPSIIHDLYPYGSGRTGIHHLCYHVDNIQTTVADFGAAGFPLAFSTTMIGGTEVAIVDTVAAYGHFIEFYEKTPEIRALYDLIRLSSVGFDGRDPVRPLASFPMPETPAFESGS